MSDIETIAESITELVLEHKGLTEHCTQVAEQVSKTEGVDLETIEGTAQHDLYWAIYAEEQIRVLGLVLQKLLRYRK